MIKIVTEEFFSKENQATMYFAHIEGGPSHLLKAFTAEAAKKLGFEYAKIRWGQTETGKWSSHPEKWAEGWPYKEEALAWVGY